MDEGRWVTDDQGLGTRDQGPEAKDQGHWDQANGARDKGLCTTDRFCMDWGSLEEVGCGDWGGGGRAADPIGSRRNPAKSWFPPDPLSTHEVCKKNPCQQTKSSN